MPLEELEALAPPALRGDFLEGLELDDCPSFQAWSVALKEELGACKLRLFGELAARLAAEPARALPYGRALAEVDPYDAPARASLIRLLLAAQHRREAEEQLRAGLRLLEDEDDCALLQQAWREGEALAAGARDLEAAEEAQRHHVRLGLHGCVGLGPFPPRIRQLPPLRGV